MMVCIRLFQSTAIALLLVAVFTCLVRHFANRLLFTLYLVGFQRYLNFQLPLRLAAATSLSGVFRNVGQGTVNRLVSVYRNKNDPMPAIIVNVIPALRIECEGLLN